VHRPFVRRTSSATNFYRVDAVNFANSIVHNEAPVEIAEHLKWKVPPEDNFAIHLVRDYNVKKAETNHSFYGDMDSNLRFQSGIRTSPWLMIWHPLRNFLYQYIRCGSVRHGTAGFIYSLLYAQLELNIQLKIWELQNSMDIHSIIRRNLSMREKMLGDDFAVAYKHMEGHLQ
jgi:hypothetical protein